MNATADTSDEATDRLYSWFNDGTNSHARECLLMHRLCFDLQLAAARRGYYLNTYYDDVDHDGFDVIFDDHDTIKKMQVKTVSDRSGTSIWNIRKAMLRPTFELIEKIGYESSPVGEGNGGGVIVQEFKISAAGQNLELSYLYTDVFVIEAFKYGVLARKNAASQQAIKDFLGRMRDGIGAEVVTVPNAMFLRARGVDELLGLAGLHSSADYMWKHWVIVTANHEGPNTSISRTMNIPHPGTVDSCRARCRAELLNLIDDDGFTAA